MFFYRSFARKPANLINTTLATKAAIEYNTAGFHERLSTSERKMNIGFINSPIHRRFRGSFSLQKCEKAPTRNHITACFREDVPLFRSARSNRGRDGKYRRMVSAASIYCIVRRATKDVENISF